MTTEDIDKKIEAVQKSTKVGVSWLLPAHEYLRGKSKHYYNWHLNPHHQKVHWVTSFLYTILVIVFVVSSIYTANPVYASSTWTQTTDADFNGGTKTSVAVASDSVTLEGYTFTKRAAVTITNGSGAVQTNYPVKVSVTYDADMQADFDDIRFVQDDATLTPLNYFTDSYIDSTSAVFWVKIPSLATGDSTIYMYYGNASATSASDGPNTFDFFDDFESYTVDTDIDDQGGWDTRKVCGAIGEAKVRSLNSRNHLRLLSEAACYTAVMNGDIGTKSITSTLGYAIETKAIAATNMVSRGSGFARSDDIDTVTTGNEPIGYWERLYYGTDNDIYRNATSLVSLTEAAPAIDTYYRFSFQRIGDNINSYRDDVLKLSDTDTYYYDFNYLYFIAYEKSGGTGSWYHDWIALRQIASTEPTSVIGAEGDVSQAIYPANGNLTSSAYDTSSRSDFETIAWNGTVPTNTTLKFQIRTADSQANLVNADWHGPTGGNDYFDTSPGTTGFSIDGAQWVQYKAYFATSDADATATLNDISITYSSTDIYTVISTDTTYSSDQTIANLRVENGATLTIEGGLTLTVTGNMIVTDASTVQIEAINNTAQVGGEWVGEGSTINTGSLGIDQYSKISSNGEGYAGATSVAAGKGPGGGFEGEYGLTYGSGGAYGGNGGYSGNYQLYQGNVYGSEMTPVDLGSGGGGGRYSTNWGGAGGGAIRLNIDSILSLNGTISSDGDSANTTGGSGGAVYVTTSTLLGSGNLTAIGGGVTIGADSNTSGGSGGRIALYYIDSGDCDNFNLKAFGGYVLSYNGASGTTQCGVLPTSIITSPANEYAGASTTQPMQITIDDTDDRTDAVAQIQYKNYDTQPDCSTETWASDVTSIASRSLAGATTDGWTGGGITNGLLDLSGGAKSPQYVPSLTGGKYYCWRARNGSLDSLTSDSYTKLLLHADGDDGSTTFTDNAYSPKSILAYNTAQIDNAQSKFGGTSAYFDGNSDYLRVEYSEDWGYGDQDFTIDFWVRFNALPSASDWDAILTQRLNGTSNTYLNYLYLYNNAGTYQWGYNSSYSTSEVSFSRDTSVTTGTWYHVALVRTGNTFKFFQDGVQLGVDESDDSSISIQHAPMIIGAFSHTSPSKYLNGWLDELRISKGVARWTDTFTPYSLAYEGVSTSDLSSVYGWGEWSDDTWWFLVNTRPEIQTVTSSQNEDGTVSIGYEIKDDDDEANPATVSVWLGNTAANTWELASGVATDAESATVDDATGMPTSGTLLFVDADGTDIEEEATFTRSGNTLTLTARAQNNTVATAYVADDDVYVKATTLSGDTGSVATTTSFVAKSATWTPKTDFDGTYLATSKIRILANDGHGGNMNRGADSSSFALDVDDPVISSFTIDSDATYATSTSVTLNNSVTDDTALQMRFSNDNETWSDWEAYAATKAWTLSSGDATKTVYAQFKDTKTNTVSDNDTIILDTTNPTNPTSVNVLNFSISGSSLFRNIVYWNVGADTNFSHYEVERSTNGVDYAQVGDDISNVNTTYYNDTGLTSTTSYYYRIKTEDLAARTSTTSATTRVRPAGANISSVSSGTPGTTSATITWTTTTESNSIVQYMSGSCSATESDYSEAAILDDSTTSHSIGLTGLSENTTYYYQVRSRDSGAYEETDDNSSSCYTFTTLVTPTGTASVDSGATYTNSATVDLTLSASGGTVSWMKFSNDGDSWSDYEVYDTSKADWNITSGYGGSATNGTKTVYVMYKNSDNIESSSITDTIVYDNVAPTTTAPDNISEAADTKPLITWSAATEAVSGVAEYFIKIGTTDGGSETLAETSVGTNTSYTPTTALSTTDTYYVQVRADDNATNEGSYSTSGTIEIDVTAPGTNSITITDTNGYTKVTTVNLTLSSSGSPTHMRFSNSGAIDKWSAWEAYATSKSSWDITSDTYGGNTDQGEKTVYAQFKDTYGNTSSAASDMTVYDTTGPTISDISESMGSTGATASVTWITNEVATTGIYYDTTSRAEEGGVYTDYASSSTDSDYDTNHRGDLSSLSTGTVYYYVLRVVDRAGNASLYPTDFPTSEYDFTTTTYPTASSISSGTPGISTATITWTTNVNANSTLVYGTTTSYGTGAGDEQESTTSHSVNIANLSKNTTYHYKIRSRDANGNIVSDTDHSFTTSDDAAAPTATVSINGGDTYTTSATANVTIDATDTGSESYVYQMRFSNDDSTWSDWETFNGTKSWDITNATYGGDSSEGVKTVYVQLKDNHTNISDSYNDSITYDATAPTANIPATVSATTNSTKPTWTWSASTDTVSGIQGYYVKIGTTAGGAEFLAETWVGDVTSYTPVTALSDSNTYYLSLKAKDGSGRSGSYNTSDTGVIIDTTAPTSNSITIADASDAGTTYTDNGTVNLTLASTGASYMKFSNNGSNWTDYEAYSTSKSSWNMTSGYGGTATQGTKTVYVKFKDSANNETDIISDTISYDATAPASGSITIKDNNEDDTTYSDSTTVDLTLSATDATSGMYQMRFSNDDETYGDWVNYATTYNDTWTLSSGDGTKTVYVQYKDNAGNISSAVSDTITLDTTSPTANTPSGTSPTSNQKPTWSWIASSDTNGVAGYYVKIGTTAGGSDTLAEIWIGNNTSYTPTSNLDDDTYYLSISAKDNVGNQGDYNTSDSGITIDTTSPSGGAVSINSGDSYTTSASVTLTITVPESAIEMNLSNDGTTWNGWEDTNTTKSWTLSAGEGTKIVYIKFRNEAQNESDVVTDTITYDATAATISNLTDVVGNSGVTATITWSTNEEATTAVYYGTSSQVVYTAYTNSSTSSDYDTNHRRDLSGLSDNTKYYYMVRSLDRAGNATVSAEGDFTTVALPSIPVPSITEGAVTISTQAITWSSNVSLTSIVEIGTSSGDYTSSQGVTASRTTSHSVAVAGLSSGTKYYYRLKGQDQYGNETTSAEGDFTTNADTSNPTGSVSGINNGATYTNSPTVNLAVNATDTGEGGYVTQMTFSNNGTTWSDWEAYAGTKSWDITNASYGGTSANGVKTVYVKLKDNSGNTSDSFTNTITYDNIAPTATAPSNVSTTNSTKPTISWSAATDATSGVEGYYIKIGTTDGGVEDLVETWIGPATSYTPITALSEGRHYTQIKAKDNATNTSSYTSSATIDIDTTTPSSGTISISSGAVYSTSGIVNLTLSATSANYMKFSNNGTNWSDWEAYGVSKTSWNMTSGNGGNTNEEVKNVYVIYKDTAGNESSVYSDSIIYDATAPASGSITIKDASDSGESYTDNATATLTLNAKDENSGIYQMAFSNDESTYSTWESYLTSKSWDMTDANYGGTSSDGTKTVYVKYKDNAGNVSSAVSDTIILDTTTPTISGNPSTTTPTNNTKPTFTWNTASDGTGTGVLGYYVKIGTTSGGAETLAETWIGNQTSYTPITPLSEGTYYFSVKAKDNAGNSANANYKTSSAITIDTTVPTSGSVSIASGATYTTSTSVTLTISASGASQMDISNDGTAWDGWDTYSTSEVWSLSASEGVKTVYIKFLDTAGNESDTYTDTIIYDATAPTISSIDDSNVGSSGETASITWTTSEEATTAIYYGTTTQTVYTGYSLSSTDANYDTNHRRDLSSLSTGTKYYYMVRSVDKAGNATVSAEGDFTTTTYPTISNVVEGTTSHTQQILTWNTNVNCNSIVEFGTSSGTYTDSYGDTVESVTSHSVTVKGLTAGTKYYYRIKSKDANGNFATSSEGDFTATSDATVPTGSVDINNSATYTNSATVNLRITATDTGGDSTQDNFVEYVKFSNNGTNWSDYEAFTGTKSWDATDTDYGGTTANGTKTVYVKLKDNSANESTATISDTITYDSTNPSANQPSATTPTSDTTPTISWTATTDSTSGIDHYTIKIGTTSGGTETVNEVNIGNVTSYTPISALSAGTYYVSIKATDGASNTGDYGTETSFVVDTTAPTGSISIDSAAAYANDSDGAVTLTLSYSGTPTQMRFSNNESSWSAWESVATTKVWNLSTDEGGSSTEGLRTIYVQYRDSVENTSSSYFDDITWDKTAPSSTSITLKDTDEDNSTYTDSTTVDLTLSAKDENSGIYQMRFSNDDVTYGDWISYNTSYDDIWTLSSTNGTKTVYAQFKDNAGNISSAVSDSIILDTVSPSINTPSASSPTNNTKPTWSWTASTDATTSVANYYIKIGTTSGAADILAETKLTNSQTNYAPTTALSQGTYYLSIKSEDILGNQSDYSSSTALVVDITAPTGSISISSGSSYATSSTVTLTLSSTDTGGSSLSQMNFSNDNSTWNGWEDYITSKSWTLSDDDGIKTVYVKFNDTAGNTSVVYSDQITLDTLTPTISSVTSSVTYNSATITWITDQTANSVVQYGTTSGSYTATQTDTDFDTNHQVTLSSLSGGITYYYRVKSTDAAGNEGVSSESSFTTVVYPVISTSSITESSLTNNSITITWTTNTASDSYVEYGTTTSYGSVFGSDTDTTNHAVTLTGLDANQKYYYKVRSTTPYGDQDTGPQKTFITSSSAEADTSITGVTKTGAAATDVITTQITINWSTAIASSSYVEYGLTSSYGTEVGQDERATSHSVTIEGLTANTTYHYRVKSIDKDGNIYVSADDTFTTGDSVTPSISDLTTSDVGLYSATISWTTTQAASTQVLYGTVSSNLDQQSDEKDILVGNESHSVKLEDLSAGNTYYFRVRSVVSNSGDLLLSPTNTFTTVTLPQISEVSVSAAGERKVTISWKTNVDADSVVGYGLSSSLGTQKVKEPRETTHSIDIDGLEPAKTYYYQVKSIDKYGNLATSSVATYTTKADITGPVISDIITESHIVGSDENSRAQVIITWSTDEDAVSQVEYGTGLGATQDNGEKSYNNESQEVSGNMVVLSSLSSDTAYHFRIKSQDDVGNTTYSDDYTVVTPTQQESAFQIIVKQLEDIFGWIGKLKDLFSGQ